MDPFLVESQELQQGYTGRLQDAESFVASDADAIRAEIAAHSSEEGRAPQGNRQGNIFALQGFN